MMSGTKVFNKSAKRNFHQRESHDNANDKIATIYYDDDNFNGAHLFMSLDCPGVRKVNVKFSHFSCFLHDTWKHAKNGIFHSVPFLSEMSFFNGTKMSTVHA